MPRHPHGSLPHIHKDVGVQCHHDNKSHKVKHCPEDQVRVAVERCHARTRLDATDTVPAYARYRPHDYGHGPDNNDHHHHTSVAHTRVQLHAEHGDVAFDGDREEVGHRCGEAGVNQALTQQPRRNSQTSRVWSRVEHQVEVSQSSKEVSSCQVGHQVVNGEVESPVDVDGDHYQKVGEHDENAHGDAKAHHQAAVGVPGVSKRFATEVVKEGDGLIVVALLLHGDSGAY